MDISQIVTLFAMLAVGVLGAYVIGHLIISDMPKYRNREWADEYVVFDYTNKIGKVVSVKEGTFDTHWIIELPNGSFERYSGTKIDKISLEVYNVRKEMMDKMTHFTSQMMARYSSMKEWGSSVEKRIQTLERLERMRENS